MIFSILRANRQLLCIHIVELQSDDTAAYLYPCMWTTVSVGFTLQPSDHHLSARATPRRQRLSFRSLRVISLSCLNQYSREERSQPGCDRPEGWVTYSYTVDSYLGSPTIRGKREGKPHGLTRSSVMYFFRVCVSSEAR